MRHLYASSAVPKWIIPLERLMFFYDTQATGTSYESDDCGLHAVRHRSQRKSEFCKLVNLHGMYAREIDPTLLFFFGQRRRLVASQQTYKVSELLVSVLLIHAGPLPYVECVVCYECNWNNSAKNFDRCVTYILKPFFFKTCPIREYLYVFKQDCYSSHRQHCVLIALTVYGILYFQFN